MNYAQLESEAGNLILLGYQKEKHALVAWGMVTDTPFPAGTLYQFENETYQTDVPIAAELALFGVDENPPYAQLEQPLVLRKVVTYGRTKN